MIRLPETHLPPAAAAQLSRWQLAIDIIPGYEAQVIEAAKRFKSRNTKTNATFNAVRASLHEMCSGQRRCAYCEDSAADEVEHIRPKAFFPNSTFDWRNYVYACGPCNGPKNNRFAVFVKGNRHDLSRGRDEIPAPPPAGDPLLIDPRSEDPLDFFLLDLRDTFWIVPQPSLSPKDRERAEYTIEVLSLNRDILPKVRKEAYDGYRARLREYVEELGRGALKPRLRHLQMALLRVAHPTVWREMQRLGDRIPELHRLFAALPGARHWR
jgi:uncharacterized protein (TIGR02646 family)